MNAKQGYVFSPGSPLPRWWHDPTGNFELMTRLPVKGYVMLRRPGCLPFVMSVRELLNTDKNFQHGPFTEGKKPALSTPESP